MIELFVFWALLAALAYQLRIRAAKNQKKKKLEKLKCPFANQFEGRDPFDPRSEAVVPEMLLDDLKNEKDRLYISVYGNVLDVTNNHDAYGAGMGDTCVFPLTFAGGVFHRFVGHDITVALAKNTTNQSWFDKPYDSLSFEEVKSVESQYRSLKAIYKRVATVLVDGVVSLADRTESTTILHKCVEVNRVDDARYAIGLSEMEY